MSNIRAIIASNNQSALRIEAQSLLDQQPQRTMERRAYTADEVSLINTAVAQGVVKVPTLRQIPVEDFSGRRSIHFVGDDDGQTWAQFTNPVRIGSLASTDNVKSDAPRPWWRK